MGIKGKVYGGLGVWGGEASQSTVSGGSDRVRSGLNFFVQGEKKRNSVSLNLSKEKKNRFDRVFLLQCYKFKECGCRVLFNCEEQIAEQELNLNRS